MKKMNKKEFVTKIWEKLDKKVSGYTGFSSIERISINIALDEAWKLYKTKK